MKNIFFFFYLNFLNNEVMTGGFSLSSNMDEIYNCLGFKRDARIE